MVCHCRLMMTWLPEAATALERWALRLTYTPLQGCYLYLYLLILIYWGRAGWMDCVFI